MQPATLSTTTMARLRLRERIVLPLDYSTVELYAALVGRASIPTDPDPGCQFTRLVAEELWRLPARGGDFEAAHPGSRAAAHLVAQELGRRTSPETQFLAYLAAVSRYLTPASRRPFTRPLPVRAWAAALQHPAEHPAALEQLIAALPGQETDDAELVPEVMAQFFRLQAEAHLAGIAAAPTRAEIFVEVSSTTADPLTTFNPLTLTALVAASAVIRAGGAVRLTLFADTTARLTRWCRSERTVAHYLMHYLGGGSVFPLVAWRQTAAPLRILVADGACDLPADVQDSVLLLHAASRAQAARCRRRGAQVATVANLHDLPARVPALLRRAVLAV